MSHAILSPSTASRWLNCPGSVSAALGIDNEDSEYADEGTAAHTLAAWALRENKDAKAYIGTEIPVLDDNGKMRRYFKVDDDMASYVQVYIDMIRDALTDDRMLLVEQRVDSGLSSVLFGPVTGTSDAAIIAVLDDTIHVFDLKYGRGIRVEADNNPQLRLYGRGVLRMVRETFGPFDGKVKLAIVQPRLDHYSEETLTAAELDAWAERAQDAIDRIDYGDETRTPTEEGCKWCPLKATCPALARHATKAYAEFKEIPVADLSDWGLGAALDQVPLWELAIEAIRKAARAELEAGRPVRGYKLVEVRQGARKWTDEEVAERTLKECLFAPSEIYVTKLTTPAKLDKLLKASPEETREKIAALVTRGEPVLAITKDTDPRPTAREDIAREFK